ncbi:putative anti-sigma regulatory factor, serine/threonine protein kinase [Paraburkholderia piptadeniae]|uniref:Anti-sigma regulatory factor, serine/threonine protein kinase n=1 Tax=Paraburkholderia piptadeniae TaxID=1701573 RepID=A0A1N7RY04_9BURK|nr:ATP-binding protein [Paraburkholderia piptadeniae]SIT40018.1 putative anti-sigma regulatory factor, serine/threonine protein kinase [Paraburkholderia piptadeniae]
METSLSGLRGMHTSFEIADASGVAFARRGANDAAQKGALNDTDAGRVALIVTEAATNMLKHAQHGELLVRALPADATGALADGVEIIAVDKGPGMQDVRHAFHDGRSTAGSPGTGLGAINRLSDELCVYSQPRLGTVLRAVVRSCGASARAATGAGRPASGTDIGGICVPYPGESVCGDAWGVDADQHGLTITVADGLGHGPDAHVAAASAIEVVHRRAGRSPATLMQLAHSALRPTRGAAVAIARLDLARAQLAFAGTGNVAATIFNVGRPASVSGGAGLGMNALGHGTYTSTSGARNSWQLTSRNGIVGHTMRDSQEFEVPWTRNALLILHSDGIGTRWDLAAYPGLHLQQAVMIAAVLYRDFSRRRDDATVVVVKADQQSTCIGPE